MSAYREYVERELGRVTAERAGPNQEPVGPLGRRRPLHVNLIVEPTEVSRRPHPAQGDIVTYSDGSQRQQWTEFDRGTERWEPHSVPMRGPTP